MKIKHFFLFVFILLLFFPPLSQAAGVREVFQRIDFSVFPDNTLPTAPNFVNQGGRSVIGGYYDIHYTIFNFAEIFHNRTYADLLAGGRVIDISYTFRADTRFDWVESFTIAGLGHWFRIPNWTTPRFDTIRIANVDGNVSLGLFYKGFQVRDWFNLGVSFLSIPSSRVDIWNNFFDLMFTSSITFSVFTPPKITASVISPTPRQYNFIPSHFVDITARVWGDWTKYTDISLLVGRGRDYAPFVKITREVLSYVVVPPYVDFVFRDELLSGVFGELNLGVRNYIVGLLFENRFTGEWYWVLLHPYTTYSLNAFPPRPVLPPVDVMPPITIPELPLIDVPVMPPRPEGIIEGLIWEIRSFFNWLFVPSRASLERLHREVSLFRDRLPFNYVFAVNNFFRDIEVRQKIEPTKIEINLRAVAGQDLIVPILAMPFLDEPMTLGAGTYDTRTIGEWFRLISSVFLYFLAIGAIVFTTRELFT